VLWQGHDFSFRGQSGVHDAANSGIGHLVSFLGTDTIPAIDFAEDYYRGKETFVGGSVPASEHSVASLAIVRITKELEAGGYDEISTGTWIDELEDNYAEATGNALIATIPMVAEYIAAKRLMTKVFPYGVLSYVADTFDYWSVITVILPALKRFIMERPTNAIGLSKVVARPDSGDPADIICGRQFIDMSVYDELADGEFRESFDVYDDLASEGVLKRNGMYFKYECEIDDGGDWYEIRTVFVDYDNPIPEHEIKGSIQCLWDVFGGTVTDKGFKLLDSHIGLIYGDSITLERAEDILNRLAAKGFASGNIVFGIGSYTYQYQTRDSHGFAMKATHAIVDGKAIDIYKDPKTDSGTKKSAKGLLRVEYENGKYVLYDQQTPEQEQQGCLVEVFRDSKLLVETSIAEMRTRLHG
jgi:nicotinamide phosphoribosyltransferase